MQVASQPLSTLVLSVINNQCEFLSQQGALLLIGCLHHTCVNVMLLWADGIASVYFLCSLTAAIRHGCRCDHDTFDIFLLELPLQREAEASCFISGDNFNIISILFLQIFNIVEDVLAVRGSRFQPCLAYPYPLS